jgi:hypothetical protein
MKHLTRLMLVFVLIFTLGAVVMPAAAQDNTKTRTLTEDQINDSYRVSNPWRRSLTDVVVHLQPGQAVISATHTRRGHDPVSTQTTLIPSIQDGRIYWEVSQVLANGEPASQDLVDQINAAIASSWRNYIRQKAGTGRFTEIQISDTEIAITYTTGPRS